MANRRADEPDEPNPYASATRWRHQESTAFARHAAHHSHGHAVPRDAVTSGNTGDLARFLNSSRVEHEGDSAKPGGNFKPITVAAAEAGDKDKQRPDGVEDLAQGGIVCGPLINYRRMEGIRWHGSVLIVVRGGSKSPPPAPTLVLRRAGTVDGRQFVVMAGVEENGSPSESAADGAVTESHGQDIDVEGNCLYSDPRVTFYAFDLSVEMERVETKWEYEIAGVPYLSPTKRQRNSFFVPAIGESMRFMFFSCNGFSVGTDEAAWSGPAMWNDVLRRHGEAPFHAMVGGGDQIYMDSIRVDGPLHPWTEIANPKRRRHYPFSEALRQDCDDYYLNNYVRWYNTEPFASANGQIPQVNIWDDHDIIDGFGSYTDKFMRCDVFRGIGGTAHKYYMLFQHHLPPPRSTYTSDNPTLSPGGEVGDDPNQLMDTFVAPKKIPPSYILGTKPGPYVAEHSHNLYVRLGARIALVGIDARTERTRHQVNYPETYDAVFARLREELGAAAGSGQPIKHLILLLGIPIAYPRLTWLENVLRSPLIGPIKFLSRRFGVGGGLFNHFDGSVDLLDDLDDHYTARTHKHERHHFIEKLQELSAEFSVRITILGGDVHLAALGRFYSNPDLEIPAEADARYMANVVSSAIVNKPPPQAIANLLARRNKIHHLNNDTDETLMAIFNKDPGDSSKTAGHNHVTMPSRNYAILTENSPNNTGPAANGSADANGESLKSRFARKDGHHFLHSGELNAGTEHKAASANHGKGNDGSLDICFRVEIDQCDPEGKAESYGFMVPTLQYKKTTTVSALPPQIEEVSVQQGFS